MIKYNGKMDLNNPDFPFKTNWNYRIHDQTALIADSVEKNEQTYNGSMSTGQQSLSAIKSANSGCLVLFWATQLLYYIVDWLVNITQHKVIKWGKIRGLAGPLCCPKLYENRQQSLIALIIIIITPYKT